VESWRDSGVIVVWGGATAGAVHRNINDGTIISACSGEGGHPLWLCYPAPHAACSGGHLHV
jgi:hypothetical protein